MNSLPEINKLTPVQNRIIHELAGAFAKITDDMNIQKILSSWGDTLPEEEILQMLIESNQ